MILLALALAASPVPPAVLKDVCMERDHPRACDRQWRRWERYAFKVCGPDGTVDWDNYPGPPACNRSGWNGRRYTSIGSPEHDR